MEALIPVAVLLFGLLLYALSGKKETVEPLPEPQIAPPQPVVPEVTPNTMNQLRLYYEAKPFTVTQAWGVFDPKTYAKYGYTRHSGVDIAHGANGRIRAPFDFDIIGTLWQKGGGMVLSIISREEYEGPDGLPSFVRVDYLHLSKYLKIEGSGKCGELICIAGNSGETYGPHTHIKYTWVRRNKGRLFEVEQNEADNSFDPMHFYTGEYAVDNQS